jgi:hypothetical protein
MAKAKPKDAPTIAMKKEQGRLVPVSSFDFELLSQYREGVILNVVPVLAQTRAKEKQYFAMLTHLLKTVETPWVDVLAAHEALKLATGFVEARIKRGKWVADPRHISTFTDSELEEFYELFCGIVRDRFGIDPETLRNEAPKSSSEEAAEVADPVDDGPSGDPIPVAAGEPTPSAATNPVAEGAEAGGGEDVLTLVPPSSADANHAWLKQTARMLVAATEPGGGLKTVGILERQAQLIKQIYTPADIGKQDKDKANKIYSHCLAAVLDGKPLVRKWVATVAGCKVEDLREEAR